MPASPGVRSRGRRAAEATEYDAAPRLVLDVVNWIDTNEGRWRHADNVFKGCSAHQSKVKTLTTRYEKRARDDPTAKRSLLTDCTDPTLVAGVLKAFMAGGKEPVLPLRSQRQLLLIPLQTAPVPRQLAEVRTVLAELPPPAAATMSLLLPVLQRVSAVSAEAAAGGPRPGTAAQLATLLSPLLLRRRVTEPPRSAEETRRADAIVELLIHHASALLHPASSASTATTFTAPVAATVASSARSSAAPAAAAPASSTEEAATTPPRQGGSPPHKRWSPGKQVTAQVMQHIGSALDACVESALLGEAGVAEDVATEVDRVAGGLLGHVYVTPIHRMAPEQVAAEKSVLKRKLRAFDSYFLAHTGNKPTRSDKEHLRRLYIRYYKLKCCVVKHAGADPRHADDATQASHDSERRSMRMPLAERTGLNNSMQQQSPLVL